MVNSDWPDPDGAGRGGADHLADEQLPLLAAEWLAEGFDSAELRQLAGMTWIRARTDARQLLPEVVESLVLRDPDGSLRAWADWAVYAMEGLFTPYSAAQKVLEAVEDEDFLQEQTASLWALVSAYDASPRDDRTEAERRIVDELLRLRSATPGAAVPEQGH